MEKDQNLKNNVPDFGQVAKKVPEMDSQGGASWEAPKGEEEDYKFFPVVVDNFFDDPDIIRDYALSLPRGPSRQAKWPGIRTPPIHEIDQQLALGLVLKQLSCFFDLARQNITWKYSNIYFHEIPSTGDPTDLMNQGWLHQDNNIDFASVVYLNKEPDLNSGTSIYKIKKEYEKSFLKFGRRWGYYPWKYYNSDGSLYEPVSGDKAVRGGYTPEAFEQVKQFEDKQNKSTKARQLEGIEAGVMEDELHTEEISPEVYREEFKKFHERWTETIRVQNLYNRFIGYDGRHWHRLNNYYIPNGEPRLTMTTFVRGVNVDKDRWPLHRVKDRENNDSFIEKRMTSHRKDEHKLDEDFKIAREKKRNTDLSNK